MLRNQQSWQVPFVTLVTSRQRKAAQLQPSGIDAQSWYITLGTSRQLEKKHDCNQASSVFFTLSNSQLLQSIVVPVRLDILSLSTLNRTLAPAEIFQSQNLRAIDECKPNQASSDRQCVICRYSIHHYGQKMPPLRHVAIKTTSKQT